MSEICSEIVISCDELSVRRSSLVRAHKMQVVKELPLLSETPMLKREVGDAFDVDGGVSHCLLAIGFVSSKVTAVLYHL